MSIIAQLFTTPRQLPSGKIVPCQDLIAARKAINPQDLKHEASGCCCITTGTIDHSEHNFTIAEVVEILEAVFGGTFGSTAKVDGNTFRVTSWAE